MLKKFNAKWMAILTVIAVALTVVPAYLFASANEEIEYSGVSIGDYWLFDDNQLGNRTEVDGHETANNHYQGLSYDSVTKSVFFNNVDIQDDIVCLPAIDLHFIFEGENNIQGFYIDPQDKKYTTTFEGEQGTLNTTGFRASFWEHPHMNVVFKDGLTLNVDNPNDPKDVDEKGVLKEIEQAFTLEFLDDRPYGYYTFEGRADPALNFEKVKLIDKEDSGSGNDEYGFVASSNTYKVESSYYDSFYPYLDANGGYFIDEYGNKISGKYYLKTYGDSSTGEMATAPYFPPFRQVTQGFNSVPMRDGYIFDCWCYDTLGETECSDEDAIMPGESVHARWLKSKHTVRLHVNNGTLKPDADNGECFPHNVDRHIATDQYELEEPIKMGDDNSFSGWYYDEKCTNFAGKSGDVISVEEDIDLYAKYSNYTGWPSETESLHYGYYSDYYRSIEKQEGNISYIVEWGDDQQYVTITNYTGTNGVLTIPDTIEGLQVRGFDIDSFENLSAIKDIDVSQSSFFVFENGVLVNKGGRVLFALRDLSGTVTIPEGAEVLGYKSFWDCSNVSAVVIPEGVREIEAQVFSGCTNLRKVVLPETLETLAIDTFTGLSNLTDIYCKPRMAFSLNEAGYSSMIFPYSFFPENANIHVYDNARYYEGSRQDINETNLGSYAEWNDYKTQVVYDLDDIDLTKIGTGIPEEHTTKPDESVTKPDEPTTKPSDEPTTKPSEETTKPVEKPTTKPSEEPTTEPSEESTTKPSEENTTKPTKNPTRKINGIVKGTDGKWAKYVNGKVDTSYTGIAKNQYGWWRVKDGYVDFNANGIYKNEYGWWKTTNGKVTFNETGIFKNEYGWWRVENSKVDFSANGIYKNQYGWWKTTNGKVTFKENGVFKNEYGWWKVENSKVNFNFTGIASNKYGKWYVKNGKVDFTKNGRVTYNSKTYTITNGKAKLV